MPKMHENTFGGQALPGPSGGAYSLPQTSYSRKFPAMGPASKEMVGTGEDLATSKQGGGRQGREERGRKGGDGIFPQSQAE